MPLSSVDTILGDKTTRSEFGVDIKRILLKAASNPQPTLRALEIAGGDWKVRGFFIENLKTKRWRQNSRNTML